MKEPMYS